MSDVTNTILHMGQLDDDEELTMLAEINRFFEPPSTGFVLVNDEEFWYGGTKALECSLAIGAFNWLSLPKLIEHLRTLSWPYDQKGCVQLIVRSQDVYKFHIIDVFPELP